MKKIALLLSMVLLSATFLAAHNGDYVKTKEGTYFFKNVRYGLKCCLVGTNAKGEQMDFKKCDVLAYSKDGITYEKMPVYKNNVSTDEEDFMKVVCIRNGLKLYDYEYISKASNSLSRRYYVFKGEKFIVEMDDNNRETLTAFFDKNR